MSAPQTNREAPSLDDFCDFGVGSVLTLVVSLAGYKNAVPELARTPALMAGLTWQSLWQLRQEKLKDKESPNVHDTPVRVVHLLAMQVALGWLYHAVVTDHEVEPLGSGPEGGVSCRSSTAIVTDVVWLMVLLFVSARAEGKCQWALSLVVLVFMVVLQAVEHCEVGGYRYRYLYAGGSPAQHSPYALQVSICAAVFLVSLAGLLKFNNLASAGLLLIALLIYPAVHHHWSVSEDSQKTVVAGIGSLTALWLLRPIGQQFTEALVTGQYTSKWDQLTLAAAVVTAVAAGKDGNRGEKGEKGNAGNAGAKGNSITGEDGTDGKDGKDGTDGKDGKDGTDGSEGNTGGARGNRGNTDEKGNMGDKVDMGKEGVVAGPVIVQYEPNAAGPVVVQYTI